MQQQNSEYGDFECALCSFLMSRTMWETSYVRDIICSSLPEKVLGEEHAESRTEDMGRAVNSPIPTACLSHNVYLEVQSLLLSVVSTWAELSLQGSVLFSEMCFVSLSTVPSRLHCSCPRGCSGSRGCPSGGLQGEGASLVERHDLVNKTSGLLEHQSITCTRLTAVCQHYKGYSCFTVMAEEMCHTEDPLFTRAML